MGVQGIFLLLTVTVASSVEMVEAVTIIVASGVSRSWRSSLQGAAAALLTLGALVALFGPALINLVPIDTLRIIIGFLLLLMGLQWLRKAVLRSGGYIRLRDEAALYQSNLSELQGAPAVKGFDPLSFTVSFKGVFLEGLEVVFIVISFGVSSGQMGLAAAGAAIASIVIGGIGVLMAKPMAKVPENMMKKGVGLMLVSFGTFWLGEGAGVEWPTYRDLAPDVIMIPLLALGFTLLSQLLVLLLSRSRAVEKAGAKP